MNCAIYFCKVRPLSNDLIRALPLSDQEWHDVSRFRHPADRLSRIQAHALKRIVLANALGLEPESLRFWRDRNGKPHLLNVSIAFSVTHTRQEIAVAAMNGEHDDIGLDIERIDSIGLDEVSSIAESILNPSELDNFFRSSQPRSYLLQCWTAKEAVLKAMGVGLALEPLALAIMNKPSNEHSGGWLVSLYHPSEMCWMSVAFKQSLMSRLQNKVEPKAVILEQGFSFKNNLSPLTLNNLTPVKHMYIDHVHSFDKAYG